MLKILQKECWHWNRTKIVIQFNGTAFFVHFTDRAFESWQFMLRQLHVVNIISTLSNFKKMCDAFFRDIADADLNIIHSYLNIRINLVFPLRHLRNYEC